MRDFCREINITMDTFTRVVGAQKDGGNVGSWRSLRIGQNQRNVSEMCRLFNALAEVVPVSQIRGLTLQTQLSKLQRRSK